MEDLLKHWPLVVFPTLAYCVLTLLGSRKLEATYQGLAGRISSDEDLSVIKTAINRNMTQAFIQMVLLVIYIGGMFYLTSTGYTRPLTTAIYIPVLTTAGFVCSLVYTRKVEKRARNMQVTAEDPRVMETYHRWVKQWSELRLRLPD